MREALLRRNIIIAIVVAFVLVGLISLVWKLKFYDTITTQIAQQNSTYTTLKGTADGLADALKEQRVAENNSMFAREQLITLRKRFRSLNYDFGDTAGSLPNARLVTWRRLLNEYYTDYGVELRKELIQSADESGVILNTNIKVQAPPANPEDMASPPSGFAKPLADPTMGFTVRGSLPNIMRFFNRVNQSQILMLTGGGFKMTTNELGVEASFNVTPYLLASGPDALLPGASAAAPAAGGTGTSPTSNTAQQ